MNLKIIFQRPIVSFSIEDRTALNARKKRLEKSLANNPLANRNNDNPENNTDNNRKLKRKHKNKNQPDESKVKMGKFDRKNKLNKSFNEGGKFVKVQRDDTTEYSGLTAKEGTQHSMRSNHKLRQQADVHRQNVKIEKKKNMRAIKLKQAAKERIKQPKQKINKKPQKKGKNIQSNNKITNKKVKAAISSDKKSFTDLVSRYKTKLVGNNNQVKMKWYE